MLQVTRPLEYVWFFPLEVPTKEGNVYIFLAQDIYSEILFNTGAENILDTRVILKHIQLLLEQPEFKIHIDKGFTLILHKYKELSKEINDIINPFGGKLLVDDAIVATYMEPVLHYLFRK
ncbi:MAG: hypothetical protein ACO1PI_07340 [Bacteroidota bacterium]